MAGAALGNILGGAAAAGATVPDLIARLRGDDPRRDLGWTILATVAAQPDFMPVSRLLASVDEGLIGVADALQALRRLRLIRFGHQRTTVQLTSLGRATLTALGKSNGEGASRDRREPAASDGEHARAGDSSPNPT